MQQKKILISVGILYSTSGSYGHIGKEMLNGILLAIDEINQDSNSTVYLQPIIYNPEGDLNKYYEYCHKLLHEHQVKHIVGCYTSASRKIILPLIESANALLWHSPRYEGFEASYNVIYLGACPNQNFLPLLDWVYTQQESPQFFHVGSNYIWSWEMDRILRESIEENSGQLLDSQMLRMNDLNVEDIIEKIKILKPTTLLVTLVGTSAYHFYQALYSALDEATYNNILKLSLTLCEPEVAIQDSCVVEDYIVSAVWFKTLVLSENVEFIKKFNQRFGQDAHPSVDSVMAWVAGHMIANVIDYTGDNNIDVLKKYISNMRVNTPMGMIQIDPENNHTYLKPKFARCQKGSFNIFWQSNSLFKPDPWLSTAELQQSNLFKDG